MSKKRCLEHDLVIDTVTLEDVASIVRIDADASGEEKADFWYGCYTRQNADSQSTFLVAKVDGEVAGYVIGKIQAWEFGSPPCGWVEAIMVAPGFRASGIATRLFDSVVAYFLDNGIATIRTMLHIDDHELMSFFRIQGMSAGPFIELEMLAD